MAKLSEAIDLAGSPPDFRAASMRSLTARCLFSDRIALIEDGALELPRTGSLGCGYRCWS